MRDCCCCLSGPCCCCLSGPCFFHCLWYCLWGSRVNWHCSNIRLPCVNSCRNFDMFHQTFGLIGPFPLLVYCFPYPLPFPLLLPFDQRVDVHRIVTRTALDATSRVLGFTILPMHDSKYALNHNLHIIVFLESSRIQLQMAFQILRNHQLNCTAFDVVSMFHFSNLGVFLVPCLQGSTKIHISTRCGALIARNRFRHLPPVNGSRCWCGPLHTANPSDRSSAPSTSVVLP